MPIAVVSVPASAIGQSISTLNGSISGTPNPTRRGFQYNTVAYPDKETYEDGSFSPGAYLLNLIGLTPGQLYYFRAFATNSEGTSYGEWLSFTCLPTGYSIFIDGEDRTADILQNSLTVEDIINDKQNTLDFTLVDWHSLGVPDTDEEIIITLSDGTILFGGYILTVKPKSKRTTGLSLVEISCIDYVRILDRNLVHKVYKNMTDAAIISDILNTYCYGLGITASHVVTGVTIDQISFNYLQPSQCIRKICDLTSRNWYIDYNKDIHYFPLTTEAAPFNITSTQNAHFDLSLSKDASQLKNRVYVRGGTKLSDATSYEELGDGVKRQFVLPDKPHNVTVKVNNVTKSLGIKNVDTTGYDWYLNYQEKYLEQSAGGSVLTATDTLHVDYQYDIPILVTVENTASIIANGVQEFAIFDKSISTTQAARDRASAELTDYATNLVEGSFKTLTNGFISGQYMHIESIDHGVDEDYIIQKVVARSLGAGNYEYQVYIANAKTMGIIRFLIELLEANKNLIELDEDEVVDELVQVTDALLNDSIHDSLVIDSQGPYATWCVDSLETTPTRARWDLFQWG